jgi:hypothetical protein
MNALQTDRPIGRSRNMEAAIWVTLAATLGRRGRAAQLFGAVWTARERDDYPVTEFERPDYEAAIANARSAIGDAAFDEAFAKGQAMTVEQILAFALETTHE